MKSRVLFPIPSALSRFVLCAGLLALGMGLAACGGDASSEEGGEADPDPTVDADAVVAAALAFADGDFKQINVDPVESSQHAGDNVNIWVSNEAVATYLAIDPEGDSSALFAPGTIIVKEQLKDNGDLSALTVMTKGPAGYDPDTDDWWWGRIEPNGDLTVSGNVSACVNCHMPKADTTDWVFGVHADNVTP